MALTGDAPYCRMNLRDGVHWIRYCLTTRSALLSLRDTGVWVKANVTLTSVGPPSASVVEHFIFPRPRLK